MWAEWRRPQSERLWSIAAFAVCYLTVVGWSLAAFGDVHGWGDRVAILAIGLGYCAIAGLLGYRVLFHARVVADERGLLIANPFRGDQRLAWGEIASMRADRLLWITTNDGQRHIAWVIQKNGVDRLRGRRTAADEAIEELGRLAGRALNTAPKQFATAAPA